MSKLRGVVEDPSNGVVASAIFQLSALVYLVLALRRVYRQPMLQTAVKGVVLFASHGAAVAALMFALIDLRYDSPEERQAQVAAVYARE